MLPRVGKILFAHDSLALFESLASPSARSYNRAYLASYLRHFAQIQQSWTSDTLGTIAEMIGNTKKEVEYHGKEKSRQSQGNCR